MPYVRCEEEGDYQWRVNQIFSDFYLLRSDLWSLFSPGQHNLLCLISFKPLHDHLYWLANTTYWNDMIEPDSRVRTNLKLFFCLQQVEVSYMPLNCRPSVYLQMPSASTGPEAALWHVSILSIVPTPAIVAYNTRQLQGEFHQRLTWLPWQVAFVEGAVSCLMNFLDTAQNGVYADFREHSDRI